MLHRHLFTSESVTEGHPDKVADQISDAVLDALLAQDPHSRVACETMVTTGLATIFGEVTTAAWVDLRALVRQTIEGIGYTEAGIGFDAHSCAVLNALGQQSRDIGQGVDTGGAGDQGMMFGFACDETEELMPLPIVLAHRLTEALAARRKDGTLPWLRPDGKSQVSVVYEDGRPVEVDTVVISTQHAESVGNRALHQAVTRDIIEAVIPRELRAKKMKLHINPTGRFVVGGPHGDAGLTGRKIIVDTYGGYGRHGGGAFSGKDPSKVDRSAAYAARWVAKNIVAAKLASKCEVQLAYAIGVAKPVSVMVDTFGTSTVDERAIMRAVEKTFDLTPRGIIEALELKKPIYGPTAAYGHFGRTPEKATRLGKKVELFTWEKTNKVAELKRAVRAG
ncbi:MAG: methionine adenosyltransferase [Gemmatimonadota bacterium]|nr:methionine adenosyltransferase [Gemmatimonadota bacterium]MDQ8169457.1 methionine adenosyltransferase [Gemmatimonadota bacterium]MDQ8175009.1 methionine adenosyltransferase [Gemmatimonadota bacterium]MDQ8178283.1 methionine adenosyltransferase [Gemmatimonadota bacterium]